MSTITKNLPVEIDRNTVQIPSNVKLVNVEFHKPNSIDMLVGAEFFFDLLETGEIDLGENRPVLLNTKFGWIIAGSIPLMNATSLMCGQQDSDVKLFVEALWYIIQNAGKVLGNRKYSIRDKTSVVGRWARSFSIELQFGMLAAVSWCGYNFVRIRIN